MTKRRDPMSAERALTTVAGGIGWPAAAAIASRSESTLRKWSNPDIAAGITLDAAYKLDRAFIEAGGDHAPFLTWYQTAHDIADAPRAGRLGALVDRAAHAARESGQALAAQFLALRPGADRADRAIARRETREAIEALAHTLPGFDDE